MKTLMRNGRDRRSENPFLGHAKKERVVLFGTDQRITSGPAARRPHSKAEYMTAPERFADSQIPLAPRAPSIHDPIEAGLVASLNRPGGNVTGVSRLISKLGAKQLQLLHELLPQVTTIALLRNPKNAIITESVTKELQAAAHTLGLQLQPVNASTEN